jgi:hypothetical protein
MKLSYATCPTCPSKAFALQWPKEREVLVGGGNGNCRGLLRCIDVTFREGRFRTASLHKHGTVTSRAIELVRSAGQSAQNSSRPHFPETAFTDRHHVQIRSGLNSLRTFRTAANHSAGAVWR